MCELKDNIIHEAQKLFSLNGYLNTGVNEIIEASGTSKGGFYNHFASKEELFLEVLTQAQKIWRGRVFHGLDEIESPTEKIIQMLTNYRDRYIKDTENFPGGCIFLTFSVELDDTRPHLAKEVYKGFAGFKGLLKELLEEAKKQGEVSNDLEPEEVSEMIFAGMLGAAVQFGIDKSIPILNRSFHSLIKYIQSFREKQLLRQK
ncbi:MAG: TetR/AcrR family transcriptional regulator [Anaerolineales bacterium]